MAAVNAKWGFAVWAVDAVIAWLLWLLRGQEHRLLAWLQANDPGEAW